MFLILMNVLFLHGIKRHIILLLTLFPFPQESKHVDEHGPYNLSLLFCLAVNVLQVARNNPTIPSFPCDVVFDPTGNKLPRFQMAKMG